MVRARRRAQVHCSPIEMDWLMTCSNSEVLLMRISLQMRLWRNWTAASRTISSRARKAATTDRAEEESLRMAVSVTR